ncbi:hypothetical protein OQA88_3323 [Cercophora sp. LCS_1]
MSWQIESLVKTAVDEGVIPGAVLLAKSKHGSSYTMAVGDGYTPDTVFALASMTKLLTCVAALQLVEAGAISLDDDVAKLLPELAKKKILKGFDKKGRPVLKDRKKKITLRHLLTHSSGCGYTFLNDDLKTFVGGSAFPNATGSRTVGERFDFPLLFEPGEGWVYGCGIDWVGQLVERVSGIPLERYFQERILAKVDVGEGRVTFYPERGVKGPRAVMTARGPDGRVAPRPLPEGIPERKEMGGEGGHADLKAYMDVVWSLLRNDGRLLKSVEELFKPQLEKKAKEALTEMCANPGWIVGTEGVCGVFGTQIIAPDPKVTPLIRAFEEEIYSKL